MFINAALLAASVTLQSCASGACPPVARAYPAVSVQVRPAYVAVAAAPVYVQVKIKQRRKFRPFRGLFGCGG